MRFCDRLAELRRGSGMNQKEFAASFGVEASKYNKWETGANRPDFETVCMLADRFNTTTDYLLGKIDVRRPQYQAMVDEYGLSPEAVSSIVELKPYMMMFNAFIASPNFKRLMFNLNLLENPQFADNIKSSAFAAFSVFTVIHKVFDDILDDMKNQFLKGGEQDAPQDNA